VKCKIVFTGKTDQIVRGNQDLEAAGSSWLKSSIPLRKSLEVTLPSVGENKSDVYSKDSLEISNDDSDSGKLK